MGNTASLPDGGDEQATAAQRPPSLGGGDERWSIVGLVAQALGVYEYPAQVRIVPRALVDQHPDERHLDKRVAPLPARANPPSRNRAAIAA